VNKNNNISEIEYELVEPKKGGKNKEERKGGKKSADEPGSDAAKDEDKTKQPAEEPQ